MIKVLGVGPGDGDLLTYRAVENINKAEILIGAKRHMGDLIKLSKRGRIGLDLEGIELVYLTGDLEGIKKYIESNIGKNICILASGDPLVYGIGSFLLRNFREDMIKIIPGISSIQYAFSRFGLDMNDVYITSSHGRQVDMDFITMHNKVAMVTDKIFGPIEIARELVARKEKYTIYIGNRLSYPEEELFVGREEDVVNMSIDFDLAVVILIKDTVRINKG